MTGAPNPLMILWITMFPREIKLCCKVLGTAMATICFKICQSKNGAFSFPSIFASLRKITTIARIQLTPWQRKVAHATPATPILKPVTNQISTAILEVEEAARK